MSVALGITLFRPTVQSLLQSVEQAEEAGIPMVWVPSEPVGPDSLTALAIVAARTRKIQLGSGIAVTYSRHPVTLANQALAIAEVAPERFRLGIGVSHPFVVERMYGLPFQKPMEYLREYVGILRGLLWNGEVKQQGKHFSVDVQLPATSVPPRTPLILAAVQKNMFRLAGEIADGAMVSWGLLSYMKTVALPALQEGAALAGRPVPGVIASAPVIYSTDFTQVRQVAYQALGRYVYMPVYQKLFADAGFPLLPDLRPSDELIKEMFIYGDDATILHRLGAIYEAGIDEVQVAAYPAQDPLREELAIMNLLGEFARKNSARQSS
ncbi:LLM class flavin-dependent oxidoreductase [Tengunoibacter tsumagoiensis]|uniref:LLM class F420-dependent oxidoreductase n=1 Tax=Tengunoibacter tsumagoiensis TaxID=2014871 RepID=A0A401ZW18_9CHLR|nr:LLM class flavin-dependent oxidoreductase [Tengunoibacter tsumagoiensis]GCE10986.1 LLM class F420-dependent oxidoreductase [Tengunoibacter tsumagoiensis]